jgi:hypothetical protein
LTGAVVENVLCSHGESTVAQETCPCGAGVDKYSLAMRELLAAVVWGEVFIRRIR